MKKLIAVAVAALGLAAVAAPKVTIDKIENGDVWSTKKVTYTVSDVPAADGVHAYTLAFDVTAYSVTTNIRMGVAQNGTFTETLDTAAIFGETRKDPKAKIRVSVEKGWDLTPVQLWADGPLFARCNVGASSPTDYGYYFWWGDTVGYTNSGSAWLSVKDGTTITFGNNPPANSTCNHDNTWLRNNGWIGDDGNLVSTNDAATVHCGAPWRMMTKEELDKLVDETVCERTWTADWEGTGKKGYVVKGKGAYASNSVFFPAAGYGNGSSHNGSGLFGYYWSSTPHSISNYAWLFDFDSSYFRARNFFRYLGQSVRAVR